MLLFDGSGDAWVAEGHEEVGEALADADNFSQDFDEEVLDGAVDEGDEAVADEGEHEEGGDEAEVWVREGYSLGR